MTPIFDKLKQQKVMSFALLLFTLILGIVIGSVINTGVKAERQNSAVAPDATPLVVPAADPLGNEFTKLTKKSGAVGGLHRIRLPAEKPARGRPTKMATRTKMKTATGPMRRSRKTRRICSSTSLAERSRAPSNPRDRAQAL